MLLFQLIAALLTLLITVASADARPLKIEDLDRIERVADPQLSPDGEWVLYSVDSFDAAADGRRNSIWMVRWSGGEPVPVSQAQSASMPRFSPDGRWVSFLREGQLWLLDRKGGTEARKVTDIRGGIGSYAWSPDSRRLAIGYREETSPPKDANGKETPEPWVIDRVRFKEDAGEGYIHNRIKSPRIYLYDLQAKSFEPLTAGGEFEETSPAWSPDGTRIAFVSNREADWQYSDYGDIYVAAAQPNSTPRRLTDFPGADREPAWSPDGRNIAFLQGSEPKYWMYNQTSLATVSVADGKVRELAASLDRDIGSPQFSADGRSVRFLVTDNRARYPAQVPLADGEAQRLLQGSYFVLGMSQSKDRIAALVSSDRSPAEVYALEKGKLRALTRHNESVLSGIDLVERESIDFVARDGERVYGMLAKPLGYQAGQRYPTILWLHGGPYSQDNWGFHN
ncbi:S9 family peptidase, partial [Steroidobacter sp.]|uniref:S9 family peptidase n=1 Tax=Steroidobacter sp. TaxID=1978227 RepID=UPI001A3D543F|nr:S9 family peptidase [Steroidobacter sp.]